MQEPVKQEDSLQQSQQRTLLLAGAPGGRCWSGLVWSVCTCAEQRATERACCLMGWVSDKTGKWGSQKGGPDLPLLLPFFPVILLSAWIKLGVSVSCFQRGEDEKFRICNCHHRLWRKSLNRENLSYLGLKAEAAVLALLSCFHQRFSHGFSNIIKASITIFCERRTGLLFWFDKN